ncbi:MAG: TonB family protein [Candidatus Margulisiibacteriota bacterium]|jgi:TonB family protein
MQHKKAFGIIFAFIFLIILVSLFFGLKFHKKNFQHQKKIKYQKILLVSHYADYAQAKHNQVPAKNINQNMDFTTAPQTKENSTCSAPAENQNLSQVQTLKKANTSTKITKEENPASFGKASNSQAEIETNQEFIEPTIQPKLIKGELPKYPKKAEILGIEAEIKLRLYVDATGKMINYEFLANLPALGFKEEIEKAIRNWQFEPLLIQEKPHKFQVIKVFYFKN